MEILQDKMVAMTTVPMMLMVMVVMVLVIAAMVQMMVAMLESDLFVRKLIVLLITARPSPFPLAISSEILFL